MLAIISLVFREKLSFLNKLRRESGYGVYPDNRLGIKLVRLEIYFENGIAKSVLYRRAYRALRRLSEIGVRRAVVSDGFEFTPLISDMGIRIIDAKPLYIKMLSKLTCHCAGILGIDIQNAIAVIHGENNNLDTLRTAMSLIADIRFLSIICSDQEEICRKISEKSGISVMKGDAANVLCKSRIDLYLNTKDDGKILEIDGYTLSISDIELELPKGLSSLIPHRAAAPFLAVLSENGLIFPKEILIKKVLLRKTIA